ncbi:mitochondrial dynamics protein MID49 [Anolis carolinensis]|uniref:mitochondrial dynamics protein MID49 n=1 Tax=Anolis carolinensis TaxID=28377 RepID=UPI002F2B8919
MADFGAKQGKRRDDRGLGGLVDFLLANARVVLGVSGAAILAIATLAVKRLIDRATNPPDEDDIKAKQKSLEESWEELTLIKSVSKVQRRDLDEPLLTPVLNVIPKEPGGCLLSLEASSPVGSRPLLCLTLQEKLLSFYQDRVSISEAKKVLGKQLAEDISTELQNFLKNKSPDLPFGSVFLSGCLCDGLVGLNRLEVSLMLPLVLEPSLWRLVPGEQTVVNDPRFGMVKRTCLEYIPRGNSPWDRFMVGGYLSSNAVNDTLRKILVASINWPVIGSMLECTIRPSMAPKELKLEVLHEQVHLDVTLCPTVNAGDQTFVAATLEEPGENLWEQSFYMAEVSKLKDLDACDSGVRQCCLNILKVILEDHPFWSRVGTGPLTHIILHLSQKELDWSEAMLAERLRDVLEELVQSLAKGFLPCFFDSKVNLLSHLLPEEVEEIGCTLYEALAEPDLATAFNL